MLVVWEGSGLHGVALKKWLPTCLVAVLCLFELKHDSLDDVGMESRTLIVNRRREMWRALKVSTTGEVGEEGDIERQARQECGVFGSGAHEPTCRCEPSIPVWCWCLMCFIIFVPMSNVHERLGTDKVSRGTRSVGKETTETTHKTTGLKSEKG